MANTVTSRDWVSMFATQKNEARRVFGETSVFLPGRTDIRYPNLSGDHWKKLKAYWGPQLYVVNSRVQGDETGITGLNMLAQIQAAQTSSDASRAAWIRDYNNYKTQNEGIFAQLYNVWGANMLPESVSVGFWKTIDPLILRGNAIMASPSPYEMLAEAVAEQAAKVRSAAFNALLPTIPAWMKWAALGFGGLWLTLQLTKGERR